MNLFEVSPQDLLVSQYPRPLRLLDGELGALLSEFHLEVRGPVPKPLTLGFLTSVHHGHEGLLTYLGASKFSDEVQSVRRSLVITTSPLAACVPFDNVVAVTEREPREIFYGIFQRLIEQPGFERLQGFVSTSARIHPTAFVDRHVYVDDHAVIGPGAVVLGNSYIGKGCVLKANCSIGGDGLQFYPVGDRNRIAVHAGGVWLAEGCCVGSSASVDRGLFGEFTYLGPSTLLDDLVHVGHAVRCGANGLVFAGTTLGGSSVLGEHVYLGPSTSLKNLLRVGDYAFLGQGSVLLRDLPDYGFALGNPARLMGWYCRCRSKLPGTEGRVACAACGATFDIAGSVVRFLA